METLKEEMTAYWTQRVEQFSALRMREFTGGMHQRWMAEFEKYLPMDHPLRILDLGTGTGFFSFLLAARGHRLTGIDLTADMIAEARRTGCRMGLPVDFQVMDAEAPQFAPGTFDALVSRNLTWGLPHLPRAYASWHDLLKPGGILINFDADYCREPEEVALPENHAHKNLGEGMKTAYEKMKEELRPTQHPRPAWDAELLQASGFHHVTVDPTVWRRIYREKDEFYNPTPFFSIVAYA